MYEGEWLKKGVFTAGGNTVPTCTRLFDSRSSARIDWLNPRTAALAPTYEVISGRPWKATPEQTLMIVPRSCGSMRRRATRVPLTVPM